MKTCLVAVCIRPATYEGVLRVRRSGYSLPVQYCATHAKTQARAIPKAMQLIERKPS